MEIHIHIHLHLGDPEVEHSSLTTLLTKVDHMNTSIDSLDSEITALQADVTAETTVNASAVALLQGIPGLIQTALAAALAAGATPAQLASVKALGDAITTNSTALAAAVTANTAAAPTPRSRP
jgi:hypothetical protein